MAIHMMVSKDKEGQPNVKVVRDYPGHETNRMRHDYGCEHRSNTAYEFERGPRCTERCKFHEPLYMETTHVGRVLELREVNGYDDSDFYAVVWDDKANEPKKVTYATTRGWSYPNGAKVDADEATREKYAAWRCAEARQAALMNRRRRNGTPSRDKIVQVVRDFRSKGTHVPRGTRAVVFWFGPDRYRLNEYRVGIRLADGTKLFTLRQNVKVVVTKDGGAVYSQIGE